MQLLLYLSILTTTINFSAIKPSSSTSTQAMNAADANTQISDRQSNRHKIYEHPNKPNQIPKCPEIRDHAGAKICSCASDQRELRCVNRGLDQIPIISWPKNTSSWKLDLSCNPLRKLSNSNSLRSVESLTIRGRVLKLNKIANSLKRPFKCESSRKLERIELRISLLARLVNLDLAHNALTAVPVQSLVNASHLRTLNLAYNHITKLVSYTFGYVQSLTRLDLSHNRIATIHPRAFDRHPDSYAGAIILETLDLSYNNLQTLVPQVFSYLTNLRFLHLHANQLQDLGNGSVWHGLVKLVYLDLDLNNISRLDFYDASDLRNLRNLSLNLNQIEKVKPCHFENLKSLETLQLMSNQIKHFDDCALDQSTSPLLKTIRLGGNPKLPLSSCSYLRLKNPYVLDVSNSHLNCDCEFFKLTHFPPFPAIFSSSACSSFANVQDADFDVKKKKLNVLCADEHSKYFDRCQLMTANCADQCNNNFRSQNLTKNDDQKNGSAGLATFTILMVALVVAAAI